MIGFDSFEGQGIRKEMSEEENIQINGGRRSGYIIIGGREAMLERA